MGSVHAFDELVRKYGGRIMRYISVRVANSHDAEDLVQDTFIRAYRKIDQYNPRWSFSTWLYTIASRTVIGHFRRSSMNRTAALSEAPERIEDGANPAESLVRGEEGAFLWDTARRILSHQQYAAVHLRYGENMNIGEIARIIGKRKNHVKVMLYRSREKLRHEIGARRAPVSPAGGPECRGPDTVSGGDRTCSVSIADAR